MACIEDIRAHLLTVVDTHYAAAIAAEMGPLGALHAIKAAQAGSGGGPLVADEQDRIAILANATALAERLAPIEADRLAAKQAIRGAATLADLKAVLLTLPNYKALIAALPEPTA